MSTRSTPQKQLQKVQNRNMEDISKVCSDDLEMQMLVLAYIQDVREEKAGKMKPGKTSKGGASEHEQRLALEDDTAPSGPSFIINDRAELSGNQVKFANCKKQLVVELFSYCEPRTFSPAVRVDSLQLAKQLLTYGWDVEVVDATKSDTCTTRRKRDQFERMLHLYMGLGSRFRNIELVDGFVDWSRFGHYALEDVQAPLGQVKVHDKVANKHACIPSELVAGIAGIWSSKDIVCNYSYMDAKVQLPDRGELVWASLFPKVRKQLSRRISEELPAVSHAGKSPGSPMMQDSAARKTSSSVAQVALVSGPQGSGAGSFGGKPKKDDKVAKKKRGGKHIVDSKPEPPRKRIKHKSSSHPQVVQPEGAPPSPTAADVGVVVGLVGSVEIRPEAGEIPKSDPESRDSPKSDDAGDDEDAEGEESDKVNDGSVGVS